MRRSGIYCHTVDQWESLYLRPKPGRTLVVGSRVYRKSRPDRRNRYKEAIGIDMLNGDGVDHVMNLEVDVPYYLGPFAHIDCISVLEHSKNPWSLARNLQLLLHSGDTLYVKVPFVWRIHSYPDDYWRFTPSGIRALFPNIEWFVLQHVPGEMGAEKLESMYHKERLYFLKTEICAFGIKK